MSSIISISEVVDTSDNLIPAYGSSTPSTDMRHSAYNLNRVTIYSRKSKKYLEILGVTEKFGLGVQNEAGQRLTELCQENALIITNTLFQ